MNGFENIISLSDRLPEFLSMVVSGEVAGKVITKPYFMILLVRSFV
jgi:hypothetical protein